MSRRIEADKKRSQKVQERLRRLDKQISTAIDNLFYDFTFDERIELTTMRKHLQRMADAREGTH